MLSQLLTQSPTTMAQLALGALGLFYLLAAAWLLLAPRYFKAPGLIVVNVEQLPLQRSLCAIETRRRWQRLFQQIGYGCLLLAGCSWLWAAQL